MNYTIRYNPLGVPGIFRDDGSNIPADNANKDFREFIAWNITQHPPLDYTTPIEPEPIPYIEDEKAKRQSLHGEMVEVLWNELFGGGLPVDIDIVKQKLSEIRMEVK